MIPESDPESEEREEFQEEVQHSESFKILQTIKVAESEAIVKKDEPPQ